MQLRYIPLSIFNFLKMPIVLIYFSFHVQHMSGGGLWSWECKGTEKPHFCTQVAHMQTEMITITRKGKSTL